MGKAGPLGRLNMFGGPKLVMVMLPDGGVKMYDGPVTAGDVMREHPGHSVGSLSSSRGSLPPTKRLQGGNTFYLTSSGSLKNDAPESVTPKHLVNKEKSLLINGKEKIDVDKIVNAESTSSLYSHSSDFENLSVSTPTAANGVAKENSYCHSPIDTPSSTLKKGSSSSRRAVGSIFTSVGRKKAAQIFLQKSPMTYTGGEICDLRHSDAVDDQLPPTSTMKGSSATTTKASGKFWQLTRSKGAANASTASAPKTADDSRDQSNTKMFRRRRTLSIDGQDPEIMHIKSKTTDDAVPNIYVFPEREYSAGSMHQSTDSTITAMSEGGLSVQHDIMALASTNLSRSSSRHSSGELSHASCGMATSMKAMNTTNDPGEEKVSGKFSSTSSCTASFAAYSSNSLPLTPSLRSMNGTSPIEKRTSDHPPLPSWSVSGIHRSLSSGTAPLPAHHYRGKGEDLQMDAEPINFSTCKHQDGTQQRRRSHDDSLLSNQHPSFGNSKDVFSFPARGYEQANSRPIQHEKDMACLEDKLVRSHKYHGEQYSFSLPHSSPVHYAHADTHHTASFGLINGNHFPPHPGSIHGQAGGASLARTAHSSHVPHHGAGPLLRNSWSSGADQQQLQGSTASSLVPSSAPSAVLHDFQVYDVASAHPQGPPISSPARPVTAITGYNMMRPASSHENHLRTFSVMATSNLPEYNMNLSATYNTTTDMPPPSHSLPFIQPAGIDSHRFQRTVPIKEDNSTQGKTLLMKSGNPSSAYHAGNGQYSPSYGCSSDRDMGVERPHVQRSLHHLQSSSHSGWQSNTSQVATNLHRLQFQGRNPVDVAKCSAVHLPALQEDSCVQPGISSHHQPARTKQQAAATTKAEPHLDKSSSFSLQEKAKLFELLYGFTNPREVMEALNGFQNDRYHDQFSGLLLGEPEVAPHNMNPEESRMYSMRGHSIAIDPRHRPETFSGTYSVHTHGAAAQG